MSRVRADLEPIYSRCPPPPSSPGVPDPRADAPQVILIQEQLSKNRIIVDRDAKGNIHSAGARGAGRAPERTSTGAAGPLLSARVASAEDAGGLSGQGEFLLGVQLVDAATADDVGAAASLAAASTNSAGRRWCRPRETWPSETWSETWSPGRHCQHQGDMSEEMSEEMLEKTMSSHAARPAPTARPTPPWASAALERGLPDLLASPN